MIAPGGASQSLQELLLVSLQVILLEMFLKSLQEEYPVFVPGISTRGATEILKEVLLASLKLLFLDFLW